MSLQQTNMQRRGGKEQSVLGERDKTRNATAVTGVEEGCSGQESMSLLSKVGRVVCSSLELSKALLRNMHDHPGSEQQQHVQDGE